MQRMEVCRFAPSTTGPAHPGTLLSGLLAWLDARSRGARLVLRLEDIDPERCRPVFAAAMLDDLAWLGLDFDAIEHQHAARPRHEAALDRLAAAGALYPCFCTRSQLEAAGARTPDGDLRYTNVCRVRTLPAEGWRATDAPLRVRLPHGVIPVCDESGIDLSQDPSVTPGDPIVRRRDGAISYMLAVVVDDAALGVTRVVRGRDLAGSTATQVALQHLLGVSTPRYWHHLLLLEARGAKLAKMHGAVGVAQLRGVYDAPGLCGWLAWVAGLRPLAAASQPSGLLEGFSLARVRREDVLVRFHGERLEADV